MPYLLLPRHYFFTLKFASRICDLMNYDVLLSIMLFNFYNFWNLKNILKSKFFFFWVKKQVFHSMFLKFFIWKFPYYFGGTSKIRLGFSWVIYLRCSTVTYVNIYIPRVTTQEPTWRVVPLLKLPGRTWAGEMIIANILKRTVTYITFI